MAAGAVFASDDVRRRAEGVIAADAWVLPHDFAGDPRLVLHPIKPDGAELSGCQSD